MLLSVLQWKPTRADMIAWSGRIACSASSAQQPGLYCERWANYQANCESFVGRRVQAPDDCRSALHCDHTSCRCQSPSRRRRRRRRNRIYFHLSVAFCPSGSMTHASRPTPGSVVLSENCVTSDSECCCGFLFKYRTSLSSAGQLTQSADINNGSSRSKAAGQRQWS